MSVTVPRDAVELCLERILTSPAFQTSPKCQAFLRFVVEHTLSEPRLPLTELTIAEQVFDRRGHYNPAEDSLVRVKASEVRRRLSQYYAEHGASDECRIELPLGGYVPRFVLRELAPVTPLAIVPEPLPAARRLPTPARKFRLGGSILLASLILGFGVAWAGRMIETRSALHEFWSPVLQASTPLLIFLPVPAENYVPARAEQNGFILHPDRVGVGAALAATRFVDLCVRTGKSYVIKAGSDLSFSDLRNHPAVIFGAFSSQWPAELNNEYRFRLDRNGGTGRIVDSQVPGREWTPVDGRPNGWADVDYAIAARILDQRTNQAIIIASGTTTFGTQGAAEFLTDAESLKGVAKLSRKPLSEVNFQVVLKTKIIGNTPGYPIIVATHFWK